MNEVNEEAKTSAIKTLAIVGFITAIVLGVWLAVQAVRVAPKAFHSLASLAQIVYGKDASFVVSSEKNIVNSGESFKINWTAMRKSGTYVFSYQCTDGISAHIRDVSGTVVPIGCGTPTTLDTTLAPNTEVTFTSEKKRFIDVPFSVRYTPLVNMEAAVEQNLMVTVVNIALAEERQGDATTTIAVHTSLKPKETTPTEIRPTEVPKPTTKPASAPVVHTPARVVAVAYPVSNPNGFIDLRTTFDGVGTFSIANGHFAPLATLPQGQQGALRFEVRNVGTKTSDAWTYSIVLPSDGQNTFTSPLQTPLRPNERATITVTFTTTHTIGNTNVSVNVTTNTETSRLNNGFSKNVQVVN